MWCFQGKYCCQKRCRRHYSSFVKIAFYCRHWSMGCRGLGLRRRGCYSVTGTQSMGLFRHHTTAEVKRDVFIYFIFQSQSVYMLIAHAQNHLPCGSATQRNTHRVPPCQTLVSPAGTWTHLQTVQSGDWSGSRDPWRPIVVESRERPVSWGRLGICMEFVHQRCLVKRAVGIRYSGFPFGFLLWGAKKNWEIQHN